MNRLACASLLVLIALGCSTESKPGNDTASVAAAPVATVDTPMTAPASSLQLTSTAFTQGAGIPARYTCEGDNMSPPLSWTGAPSGTKSLALIVEDPDAPDPAKPQRIFVHWVVYNIPSSATSLTEDASRKGLPTGATPGKGDAGKTVYGGPCPPIGRHRYFFRLYALDTERIAQSGANKSDLVNAMKGHVLGSTELMGTYQKTK